MKLCESLQSEYFKEPFPMENNTFWLEHDVQFY